MEMIMALRYSIRPYPNGCLRSAGFAANFVPMIVISEEAASLILLTASIVMAIEPVITPITALNAANTTFARIPMMLVRTMMRFLDAAFSNSSDDMPARSASFIFAANTMFLLRFRSCVLFPARILAFLRVRDRYTREPAAYATPLPCISVG